MTNTNVKINSVLTKVVDLVFAATKLSDAKELIIDHIKNSGIKDIDKKRILFNVSEINNLQRLWQYTSNLILKYEGLGLTNYNK
jgi:hypothetical protein